MANDFHWPNGKRICVSVSVMLETWSDGKAPPYGVQATAPKPGVVDLAGIAWGSYGGRIGVYRLINLLNGSTAFEAPSASTAVAAKSIRKRSPRSSSRVMTSPATPICRTSR